MNSGGFDVSHSFFSVGRKPMLFRRSSLVVVDEGGRVGVISVCKGGWVGPDPVCKFSTTMDTVRVGPKAVLSLYIRFQELGGENRKSDL